MSILRRLREFIETLRVFFVVWRMGELELRDLPLYLGFDRRRSRNRDPALTRLAMRPRSKAGFDGGDFQSLVDAVTAMQRSQRNWSRADLGSVTRKVAVVAAENDEFIRREHLQYLAKAVRSGNYIELSGVSHFAPVQDPQFFNMFMVDFIERLPLVFSREYMVERGLLGKNI